MAPPTPSSFEAPGQLLDWVTEQVITGKGFSLDPASYRDGYLALHALYEAVGQKRKAVQSTTARLQLATVSDKLPGLARGAGKVQMALTATQYASLDHSLAFLEVRLARLLNALHDSYAAYQRTDQESSFDLVNAAAQS